MNKTKCCQNYKLGCVHIIPESFYAAMKIITKRASVTHKNGFSDAISVTELGCAAPISNVH